jgi:hypothetical protein
MATANDKLFSLKEAKMEELDRRFLPRLLEKMIYPVGRPSGFVVPSPAQLLDRFIEAARNRAKGLVCSVSDSVADRQSVQLVGQICDAKVKPLQVGALLYALYWLPQKLGPEYSTVDVAAQMVAPPFSSEPTSAGAILKSLDDFVSVSHYWAAYLIVAHPNNYFGIWDENCPPVGIDHDSLYDFVANVDLKIFLGYAAEFLRFRQAYKSSSISTRGALIRENLTWVTPLPSDIGNILPIDIPDLWGTDYPFAKFKGEFDRKKDKASQKDAERRQRERTSE